MRTKQYAFLRKYTNKNLFIKQAEIVTSKEEKEGVGHGHKSKLSSK